MVGLSLIFLAWALDVFVDDVIGLRGAAESFIKRGALIFAFTAGVFCIFAGFEILGSCRIAGEDECAAAQLADLFRHGLVLKLH